MQVSYSFNINQPPAEPREPQRWIWQSCDVYPLSDSESLVRVRRTGAHAVLRNDVLQLMPHCQRFRTLDGHAEMIAEAIPMLASHRSEVRQILETLVREGLLRSIDDALQSLTAGERSATGPSGGLERVFLRTADRPDALARAVESLAEHAAPVGVRITVVDDSRKAASRQASAAACGRFERVDYFGRDHQHAAVTAIARALPDQEDAIRWLLDPEVAHPDKTYGRALNWALVLGAGQRFAIADDDMVCSPYAPPLADRGASVFADRPRDVRFFDDAETMLAGMEPLGINPLQAVGDALGEPFSEAVELEADAIRDIPVEQLERHERDGRVGVVTTALLGDPGSVNLLWLLGLTGESHDDLVADGRYPARKRSLLLWKGWPGPRVPWNENLMLGALTALDGTRMLPPVVPFGASEDALLGEMMRALRPADGELALPWALPHLPDRDGIDRGGDMVRRFSWTDLSWLGQNVERMAADCRATSAGARMKCLAACLSDLAASDEAGLRANWTHFRDLGQAGVRQQLSRALAEDPEGPAEWVADCREALGANSQFSGSAENFDVERARALLGEYAAGLRAWADIWELCRQSETKALLYRGE